MRILLFLLSLLICLGCGRRVVQTAGTERSKPATAVHDRPVPPNTRKRLSALALLLLTFKPLSRPALLPTTRNTIHGLAHKRHRLAARGRTGILAERIGDLRARGLGLRSSILSKSNLGEECTSIDEAGECVLDTGESEDQTAVTKKNVFAEMSALARELGSAGVDLGQGFPDFDPPQFVVQALRDELEETTQMERRITHQYTRTAGYPLLSQALADRYSKHLGYAVNPMTEVAVTVGATNALFLSLQTVLEQASPGCDEIVVLEPFFELYRAQTRGLHATLKTVPMDFDEASRSFALDIERLRRAIGPQTAAIIVNSPNNPTGKAFEENELLAIADLVRENPHVVVISDEVYKFMIFDPPERGDDQLAVEAGRSQPIGHVHFAGLPDMRDRTITVSSAGKTFGITGWQVGWAIGPEKWLGPMHTYMSNLQFCAPTLMQRALTKVLKLADAPFQGFPTYYAWLRHDYSVRRQRMVSALEAAGIPTARAQSGFFLLADIGNLLGTTGPMGDVWEKVQRSGEAPDWTFCRAMVEKLGIVALPVSPFFGPDTPEDLRTRFVRFCFAKTDSTLDEAAKRLRALK